MLVSLVIEEGFLLGNMADYKDPLTKCVTRAWHSTFYTVFAKEETLIVFNGITCLATSHWIYYVLNTVTSILNIRVNTRSKFMERREF